MQDRCNLSTAQCGVRPASYKNVKHWATVRLQRGIKTKNVNTSRNLLSYTAWKESMRIERNALLWEMKVRASDTEPSLSRSAANVWHVNVGVKNCTLFGRLEALFLNMRVCTYNHNVQIYPTDASWWVWLQNAIRLHFTTQVPNYRHAS